jgi:hypothetical protein
VDLSDDDKEIMPKYKHANSDGETLNRVAKILGLALNRMEANITGRERLITLHLN